jgi:hypothetical protein
MPTSHGSATQSCSATDQARRTYNRNGRTGTHGFQIWMRRSGPRRVDEHRGEDGDDRDHRRSAPTPGDEQGADHRAAVEDGRADEESRVPEQAVDRSKDPEHQRSGVAPIESGLHAHQGRVTSPTSLMRRTSSARSDDGCQWYPINDTTATTNGIARRATATGKAAPEVGPSLRRLLRGRAAGAASTRDVGTPVLIHLLLKRS